MARRLSEIELLSLSMLILGAGHETTTNLIANAVLALLRNPGERRRLQDDPSLIGAAVEEFLRYDSPVQLTDRVATVDCEIAGHRVGRACWWRCCSAPPTAIPPVSPIPTVSTSAAQGQPPPVVRPRRPLLPRRRAGARRGADRDLHPAAPFPRPSRRARAEAWKRSMVLRGPTALRVWW